MGRIIHQIYLEGKFERELESADLYDTLSTYRMVAGLFYDWNLELKKGKKLKIISYDKEHMIQNEDEFRNWIKKEFNSINRGFEKYLNKRID